MSTPFPLVWWSAFSNEEVNNPRTKWEWQIYHISAAIREKPQWKEKYKRREIFSKWTQEVSEGVEEDKLQSVMDYVQKELQWYENLESQLENGFTMAFDDMIVSSKTAVKPETNAALKAQTDELYALFGELDYHPDSGNRVVDLVHPSLYLLMYGKTVDSTGKVVKIDVKQVKKGRDISYGISEKFQWLPSEMTLNNGKYEFSSYINNLHPKKFADLYHTIAHVFNNSIPGVNHVLARLASPHYLRVQYPILDDLYFGEFHEKLEALEEIAYEDETAYDLIDAFMEKRREYAKPIEIRYKKVPETVEFDIRKFSHLKVIVKLANIELTPQNPAYPGGRWHLEGTVNEDIVATILYYYDMENITESRLAFRCAFEEPQYPQSDDFYPEYLFGLQDEDDMTHNLGSVAAEAGKVVIFPNKYQHNVRPFELQDKTKNGFRKILCFFLVDPHNDTTKTTAEIPPQQPDWQDLVAPEVREKLPQPMTLEEAKQIRMALMAERGTEDDDDDEFHPFVRLFSLCEH